MFRKRKKERNKIIGKANNIIKEEILKKALLENKNKKNEIKELNDAILVALENAEELRKNNQNLERNLQVLITTIENIKEICNNSNGKVISKNKVLKEIKNLDE